MAQDSEQIIWMRPEVTGHGKRPSYTREEIARAAIAIADAEGIDAVSMRRVAREIGAGTMSLYRYVHNKEELSTLMVDVVMGPSVQTEAWQPPEDWRDGLRELAWRARDLVLEHPWFAALQAEVSAPGPNMVRGMEYAMAIVDGLGLQIDEMLEIVMMVMVFATGMAQDELAERRAMLRAGLSRQQWQFRGAEYVKQLIDSGEHPYLRRVVLDAKIPHEDPESRFQRAVDRLIAGIAATIEPRD